MYQINLDLISIKNSCLINNYIKQAPHKFFALGPKLCQAAPEYCHMVEFCLSLFIQFEKELLIPIPNALFILAYPSCIWKLLKIFFVLYFLSQIFFANKFLFLFLNKLFFSNVFNIQCRAYFFCQYKINPVRALALGGVKTPQLLFQPPKPKKRAPSRDGNPKLLSICEQSIFIFTTKAPFVLV